MKNVMIEGTNKLCVEFNELVQAGISENTLTQAKSRNSKSWLFIDDPDDKRKVLFAYESLRPQYKDLVLSRFGNPYDVVARQPIYNLLPDNNTAFQFFLSQNRNNSSRTISIQRVRQYTRASQILDLLKIVEESRNKIVKKLNLTVPEFYGHLKAIIEQEKKNGRIKDYEGFDQLEADFPATYENLRKKLNRYKEQGLSMLIDPAYGNQAAAKINDELTEAKLLDLIENPNQYDDVLVCMMYNMWAAENNYSKITPATVGVWRRKKEDTIIMGREGNAAFNEKFIRQVKGIRPSQPMFLVEHDDNNLDFLFTNPEDATQHKDFYKYVAITVTDSYCDLLLGKSYIQSSNPKKWMVKAAYLDAMYYIRSLTGAWHLPFETKGDRWAKTELYPFYESIGKFVPPAKGNKHRGYIEQYFRSPLWKRMQKIGFNNYTGNNMTAKTRGVNMEMLNVNKRIRPLIGTEAELQIETFFHRLRHFPDIKRTDMDAPSKECKWLTAWSKLSDDERRPITEEQFFLIFGIKHAPQGRPLTITNRGVEPQICNQKYSFDLPPNIQLSKYVGAKVNVVYDPYDMSRVLVTNGDDIRFIATEARLTPRAIQDSYTDSRTYLNALLAEKKDQVNEAANESAKRKDLVYNNGYDPESVLNNVFLPKEVRNNAQQLLTDRHSNDDDWDPIDDM